MNKSLYIPRLLALLFAPALLLVACSRGEVKEPNSRAFRHELPQGDPVVSVPMSITLGSPDASNPLEALDGIAPEPGTIPIIYIAVVDVASRIIEFEKMVAFQQDDVYKYKYESLEEIPLRGGKKDVYALYYPNMAGRHLGSDGVYYFTPNARKEKSDGVRLNYTFLASENVNVFSPNLDHFWQRGATPAQDKYAAFPIVLHKPSGKDYLVAVPHATHKKENMPEDAYNSWGNDNDAINAPKWRAEMADFVANRTGQQHGTIAPDASVCFNETKKIQLGSYEEMVAHCIPTTPLAQNYNYNGVYKLPHNALASWRTTIDVDAMIAANPSATQYDVDLVLHRDYARVCVFIAKDKDRPADKNDPSGPQQRIGLRGIGFVNMPAVAAPSFRSDDEVTSQLWSVSYNPAGGGRTYNDDYAVEYKSGELKYPELKAAPTGANDNEICEKMRQNPQDYMYLLPQYIAPFSAPNGLELDDFYVNRGGLVAIKDGGLYTSAFSLYKATFSGYPKFPRILVATYYADRNTDKYKTYKDFNNPVWTHWVPFGEPLPEISTAVLDTDINPAIRSLYSGHILPGHNYDVFIIVPTPETRRPRVIVKSWKIKSITIPDFE